MTNISLSNYEYDFSGDNFLHTGTSSGMIEIEEPSTLLSPKIYFRIRPTQSYPMGTENLIWLLPRLGESGDSIKLVFGRFSDWSLSLQYGSESLDITPAFQLGVNYSVTFAFGGRADNGKAACSVVIRNEDTKQQEYFGSIVVENYPLNGYKRLWLRCNTSYIVDYAGKSRLKQDDSATTLSSLFVKNGFGTTNAI